MVSQISFTKVSQIFFYQEEGDPFALLSFPPSSSASYLARLMLDAGWDGHQCCSLQKLHV